MIFVLFPNAKRQTVALEKGTAARAFPRIVPDLNFVRRRNRASCFEFNPAKAARFRKWQTAGNFFERRRSSGRFSRQQFGSFRRSQNTQADDGVENFPAITADRGLHRAILAVINTARDDRPVSAFRTLEQIRSAHGIVPLRGGTFYIRSICGQFKKRLAAGKTRAIKVVWSKRGTDVFSQAALRTLNAEARILFVLE